MNETPLSRGEQHIYLRQASQEPRRRRKHTYKILILLWLLLTASGVTGTAYYIQYLKKQLAVDLAKQTQSQLEVIQTDYAKQINDLKTAMDGEMNQVKAKVDALNELLAFTKDSANSKTDNSNQLYTQLSEVKQKLEELQKNLDVLK